MAFRERAIIRTENRGNRAVRYLFYHVDYCTVDTLPEIARYFHAAYRDEMAEASVGDSLNPAHEEKSRHWGRLSLPVAPRHAHTLQEAHSRHR